MTHAVKTFEPAHFINRELSWLEFNQRVLNEAQDASNPLLERLKFFCITSSNLDEFFEVRVAGLKEQIDSRVTTRGLDGLTPNDHSGRGRPEAGSRRPRCGTGPDGDATRAGYRPTATRRWKPGR